MIAYPIGDPTPNPNRGANRGRIARPATAHTHVSRGAIHACNPTSRSRANSLPVDNATAATHTDRHAWMALREIRGGW